MAKVVIVFASLTGNTEEMAEAVAAGVEEAGMKPDVVNVMDAKAADLAGYDGILLGAYTWGDGELPDEFLDYYAEMDTVDLTGRKSAVFGSADSGYEYYGAAVDILLAKLAERGSVNVHEGVKIELSPSAQEQKELRDFGRSFAMQLL